MNSPLTENKLLASIWFSLSLIVFVFACFILSTEGKSLFFGILGLSSVLFFIARQRISKLQVNEHKFKKIILTLSLFTAISSSLSVIFVSS
jgi:fumarate reductase subunit C